MKNFIFLAFLLLISSIVFSQKSDTLNRFDAQNRKMGYWICYLDSNLNVVTKDKSSYYGYEFFQKGKKQTLQFESENWRKKMITSYEPFDKERKENPVLLHGIVKYFYKDSVSAMEVYNEGLPQYWEENYIAASDKGVMTGESFADKFYFDSLYNGIPFTLLMYRLEKDVPLSKQYIGKNIKTDIIYLVPHKTVKSIDRPRLGYIYQQRSFLELGYSKKYSKVTEINGGATYFDNYFFPGFTLSLLGSWNKKNNYFGQKALFTYALMFANTEVGFVNYTNFHQNDLRFTIGTGISFIGRISLMYHYSQPLLENRFGNIAQHSISLIFY